MVNVVNTLTYFGSESPGLKILPKLQQVQGVSNLELWIRLLSFRYLILKERPKLKIRKDKIYGTFAPISSVLTHFFENAPNKNLFIILIH